MNLPNLRHLQYLVALHKYQHFNKAAQASFVSQSTLSSAIVKLEEQMGCQLIERDHKSFIFTPQGERVVEMARQLIVNATEMMDFAEQQGDPCKGSIRIGCIPTIAPYLLTDLVFESQQKLPDLSLYLDEDTTENLLLKLANGDIDTAILALPVETGSFQTKVLGKDHFYMAGDKHLIERFKPSQDYEQLPEGSVFLLSDEHCMTEHALSACNVEDKTRIHPFSAASISTLVQMTAFHHGFTFLPEMAVKKGVGQLADIAIEPFKGDRYREIGMLWRSTSLRRQAFSQIGEIVSNLLEK
ncbi:hydrogen peroxide-inducible genes activator [Thalassotalea agarivorans]|uniref:LysR family transcriptional regulator, hydrogen peroxide-inducible genes activator n=1 Tax=Thalassotalea agarivorans TaxID=349064 RepID=A0A1I0AHH6_THASX|nr:hydrogen peroxide-inducible genes activator [Thalassotalea agarivorans]SES93139.1 LysR family transcriptional regulator, hydrogen peroxide-inducible genes activator [Thalassotalea agarivorans]